jgi:hypothetical protein
MHAFHTEVPPLDYVIRNKRYALILHNMLSDWSGVLSEKPLVALLVKFRLLWHPKVHYCVQKDPPMVPILSHINPANITHPSPLRYILKLSSLLRVGLPTGSFLFGCTTKT